MKKKWILITVVTSLLLTLVGCGKNENEGIDESISSKEAYVNNDKATPTPTPIPTIEATVAPTVTPETTTEPTIKPTEVTTVEPTVKPTVEPTIKPTETVKPTIKPTEKPKATKTPTKKPAKTYWYVWYDGPAEIFEKSELPPDKYPVPEGYSGWTNKIYVEGKGEVWEAEYMKDVLAYNSDGTLNLKECVVYWGDDNFLNAFLKSKELKSYLDKIGVKNVTSIAASIKWLDANDARSFEYAIRCEEDYQNGFFYIYLDKDYKVTEENPFE